MSAVRRVRRERRELGRLSRRLGGATAVAFGLVLTAVGGAGARTRVIPVTRLTYTAVPARYAAPQGDGRYVLFASSAYGLDQTVTVLDTTTGRTLSVAPPPASGMRCTAPAIGSGRLLEVCNGPNASAQAPWLFIIATQAWQQLPTPKSGVDYQSPVGIGTHWAEFSNSGYPEGPFSVFNWRTGEQKNVDPSAVTDASVNLDAATFHLGPDCPDLASDQFLQWVTPGLALMENDTSGPGIDATLYLQHCGSSRHQVLASHASTAVADTRFVVWQDARFSGVYDGYDLRRHAQFRLSLPEKTGDSRNFPLLLIAGRRLYAEGPTRAYDAAIPAGL